jgi:GH35 family endo-1,4-beta-xylanase
MAGKTKHAKFHDNLSISEPAGRIAATMCAYLLFIGFFASPALSQDHKQVSAKHKKIESEILKKAAKNAEQYKKGEVTLRFLTADGKPVSKADIHVTQTRHDFLFGNILFDLVWPEYRPGNVEQFKKYYKNLYNLAIIPFYWAGYEKLPGHPEWQGLLPAIEWCRAQNISMKGHPLVWASIYGSPEWAMKLPVDYAVELLKARVTNTVLGFSDDIHAWDVVNEPVNIRMWPHFGVDVWTRDPIPKVADFTDEMLRCAHKADPRAQLLINDFNLYIDKDIRKRFLDLALMLKEKKAPLSVLGVQSHELPEDWWSPQVVLETLDTLATAGYPLHITEFIPQSSGKPITGGWRTGTWTEEAQADFAEQFYRICFGHPAVEAITWWGFSDRNIWRKGGGLLTEEYEPKPVYERLNKLINEEWKTKMHTQLQDDGGLRFKGFYGLYDIRLTLPGGQEVAYQIHVRKDEANDWTFRIP